MIDIGVNLTNKRFDKDRGEVITRAINAGVNKLLITGTSVETSRQAVSLCQEYQQAFPQALYSTAGVHPHDADQVEDDFIKQLKVLALNPEVKAIGECGLDFNRNFSAPEQQIKVFAAQIELAAQLKMPLFLHQRDAFSPWFSMLEPYVEKVPAMVSPWFYWNESRARTVLECGYVYWHYRLVM